jgi:hypothetical protein
MLLYALIGIFFIVVGHTAYKIATIFEHPEKAAEVTRQIGRFFFVWAFLVTLAAVVGAVWFRAPLMY